MTNINILQELEGALDSAASVAASIKNKISVIAVLGLIASGSIAWLLYSSQSSVGWNITKCGLILLPAIILCSIWRILSNFADTPKQLSLLTNEDDGLISNLQSLNLKRPKGISGLIATVRAIRSEESLSSIAGAVGGMALLVNPLVLLISFVSIAILLSFIIIAPFVLIF